MVEGREPIARLSDTDGGLGRRRALAGAAMRAFDDGDWKVVSRTVVLPESSHRPVFQGVHEGQVRCNVSQWSSADGYVARVVRGGCWPPKLHVE
jgi:hypothetical protein